jgi:hypothetical protein|tara:strand:+ start:3971 stop:4504 length:534 start_codon:yes stop_codon:yes gene_type:complete
MLYHGTTLECALSILENGFDSQDANWIVSDGSNYFWSVPAIMDRDGEDQPWAENEAIESAYHAGMYALAYGGSRVVVLEVELDEDEYGLEDDFSCENMDGAVVTHLPVPASAIRSIRISPDLSLFRGLFIRNASMMELAVQNFTETELKIAQCFENFDFEMDEFELEETTPKHLSTL